MNTRIEITKKYATAYANAGRKQKSAILDTVTDPCTSPNERSTTLRFRYAAASKAGGRPPLLPRLFRVAIWFFFSGITALMPRERK